MTTTNAKLATISNRLKMKTSLEANSSSPYMLKHNTRPNAASNNTIGVPSGLMHQATITGSATQRRPANRNVVANARIPLTMLRRSQRQV